MYDVYIEQSHNSGTWKYDVLDGNDYSLIKGGFDDYYEANDYCNDMGYKVK